MTLTDRQIDTYSRQIILRELGGIGQGRLLEARCLLRGNGPAFASAATYLAGAGIGRLDLATSTELTPLGFAPLEERNPDVRVAKFEPSTQRADYDVLIETPGSDATGKFSSDTPGTARCGEIAIGADSQAIRLHMVPATEGCLDCLREPPPGSGTGPTIEMAMAGTMAALTALRWLTTKSGTIRAQTQQLDLSGNPPTWMSTSLRRTPVCPRPCRTTVA